MEKVKSIKQMIEETDIEAVRGQLLRGLRGMPYDPYPFQFAAHFATSQAINNYKEIGPFIVKAAVSAVAAGRRSSGPSRSSGSGKFYEHEVAAGQTPRHLQQRPFHDALIYELAGR